MTNIMKLSRKLSKRKVYNKIEKNFIKTIRSKVKIPIPNKDIAYLLG